MLAKLEGFADAVFGRLDTVALTRVAGELDSFVSTVLTRSDLSAVLTDTSITGVARGQIVDELLQSKVALETLRLCVYASTCVPAPEVPRALDELSHACRVLRETGVFPHASLGLLLARQRVAGFCDALLDEVDTESFTSIEDDLFRWARTVEANDDLRHLLLDRDAPLESRLGLTEQLLSQKAQPVALALARFVIVGGRPRDVVGTLDFLVNYVAQTRDWRVARVFSARDIDSASASQLVDSLSALTGKSVELQIAHESDLISGVLVEIGDLRLDASTRGRLSALRDAVTSGHVFEGQTNAVPRNE
jgi:F0F1-type ATP synthase delta subunit